MIKTKQDLKRYLATEKNFYIKPTLKKHFLQFLSADPRLAVYRYVKALRRAEYHEARGGLLHALPYLINRRKRSLMGMKLGIDIWEGVFDEGLVIYHAGNIVVNNHARVGKNCRLHGSNCIGNNGKDSKCPVIGDNVRLGVGAKILGDITLADDITVAAGAVVVHSFTEKGITIGGIPAKKIG